MCVKRGGGIRNRNTYIPRCASRFFDIYKLFLMCTFVPWAYIFMCVVGRAGIIRVPRACHARPCAYVHVGVRRHWSDVII